MALRRLIDFFFFSLSSGQKKKKKRAPKQQLLVKKGYWARLSFEKTPPTKIAFCLVATLWLHQSTHLSLFAYGNSRNKPNPSTVDHARNFKLAVSEGFLICELKEWKTEIRWRLNEITWHLTFVTHKLILKGNFHVGHGLTQWWEELLRFSPI